MFERIRALLEAPPRDLDGTELQVAAAALLVEAARMDDHFDEAERRTILRLLSARFGLDADASRDLLAAAERAADETAQLYRFTHTVVERMGPAERVALIEMLWEVAYADGVLDPAEDALIRRVAGLIFVSDQDRGAARLRVLARRDATPAARGPWG